MVSIEQRLDVNQRTERGYWDLDSVNKPVSPSTVQKHVDENKSAVYIQNGIRTTMYKPRSGCESDHPEVANHVALDKKDPKSPTEPPNSPEVRYRFQRNPSMTTRAKKLNRRSMPAFKINAEGIIEEIDLPETAKESQNPGSARRKMSANLSLATSPPVDITSPPILPRSYRSGAFLVKSVPSHFSLFTEAAESNGANVQRTISCPGSETSQPRPISLLSDFRLVLEPSSSFSQSQDDAIAQSVSKSPISSPPVESPDPELQPKGLSRKRSHVVKRKVRVLVCAF